MNISRSPERPLADVRVMVTRPEDPYDPLAEQLRRLGAEVIVQPAIRISPPADWRPVDAALARLHEFDWLVFSSANGVRYLLERLRENGDAGPSFSRYQAGGDGAGHRRRVGAIRASGRSRARAVSCRSIGRGVVHEAPGRRFLLARASRGREVLAEQLTAAGAAVEQIVVYSSTDVEQPEPDVAAMLRAGRIDWITVTSSAIARSLVGLFGEELRRAKLASISPLTSGVLRELGYQPAAEAAEYTMAGLVTAIVNAPYPFGRDAVP